MWKEVVEYMEKVCSEDNKNELMSVYLTHIVSKDPRKRIRKSEQYLIALDVIKIKNIMKEFGDKSLEILYNEEYKSKRVSDRILREKTLGTRIVGIEDLVNQESKNIELAFILKNIENYHDWESLKYAVTVLIALLSIIITFKTS